ncbi:PREDICTED: LEAF RUST 10 DISEASE-RESISTANCE LOCUS RECEPTOR-LIKE PROTEIN KINASE-like 2.7 [Camelina sativa]|uniref:non-specific serine/threonine protein kinase n=1 Tax=Camelina sativa TaxID=90675 RepID=A0ABM1Q792_CAMSA|nr:PREDICTED: LEAF RUST 10 DISEASE-RESISTANCE LOCUS RECEPTOR-LIKE PROTEIN KINASE-like 2.7 [Camelina sativa]
MNVISKSGKIEPNFVSQGSFTVNVPTSFFPKVEKLNLTFLESVLRKGFEVKVKNNEILCEECSSSPALYRRCAEPFSCGDQGGLLFPFWIHGREDCGHPDFKLHCSSRLAELNVSSGTFRILDANYDSRIVRLARSDFKDIMCPTNPLHVPFDKSVVLPFAPDTMMLTIYYHCADLSSSIDGTSANVGSLVCGNYDEDSNNYYEMRNITDVNSGRVSTNLKESCNSYVSIPVPGSALYTLRPENLTKTLEQGFELELNQDCSVCLESKGACGYNETSRSFVCYCNDGTFGNNCSSKKKSHGTLVKAIPIFGGSVAGVVLFLVFLTLLPCLIRKRETRLRQQKLKALIPLEHYTYAQVKRITKSFAEVVGTGGFGIVYRGTLSDGRMVAVKVLKDSKGNGEDFINEVSSMSQTSHVNIVSLLGFCSEGSKRAIIYEFLGNGSLDKFISNKKSVNMDWEALYRIALGVARGLEYLHHGCKTRIVHFDIKPQNVLLDDNFCPKVSDFGLAKLCEKKESILSLLDTRGTVGYIAPEMISRVYGNVSHKSDVYSYGMLVLEMIGARNKEKSNQASSSNTSSMYFPEWIYRDLELVKDIEDGINNEEDEVAKKMTLVGLWCIQPSPLDRPPMNRVVEMMEGSLDALEVPPRPVFQIPTVGFQDSSTFSEDTSVYTQE